MSPAKFGLIKSSTFPNERVTNNERRLDQMQPSHQTLVACCKRQQSDVAGLLDGASQTALVRGANAGEAPRHNLAALGHKSLQQSDVAVRNCVNLLGTKLADLLAAEELATAARSAGGSASRSTGRPSAGAGRP
jgi:hypothetical protein